jgi:hypothetical protein
MGVVISKQELDEKIKKISQTNKSEVFNNEAIKNRKARFIGELHHFKSLYVDTEEGIEIISRVITTCKKTPKEVFLLKLFSDNYYNKKELQNQSTFIVQIFNKIHSVILNSSCLSAEQRLDCVNFQRILMKMYSKMLT